MAEVRVYKDNGDLTLTHQEFEYYYNTTPETTIAFGPGLLQANAIGTKTVFIVQARNMKNQNRQSGKDKMEVDLYMEHEEEVQPEDEEGEVTYVKTRDPIEAEVKDVGDGTYEVTYMSEKPGEVNIVVSFEDPADNKMRPIRGAPYKANFVKEADKKNNTFTGP